MPTTLRTSLDGPTLGSRLPAAKAARKVAIVNGTPAVLSLVEHALDAGNYDVVFIESVAHAYSHIKRVKPDLVIVCVRLATLNGFEVLSMLHLDEDTRRIPVLTYIAEYEGHEEEKEDEEEEESDDEDGLFSPVGPGAGMN